MYLFVCETHVCVRVCVCVNICKKSVDWERDQWGCHHLCSATSWRNRKKAEEEEYIFFYRT